MKNGKLNGGMKNGKVHYDYRDNIVIDRNNPILAFKANRDRYSPEGSTIAYGGLPQLGALNSEDALTWNIFRKLYADGQLHLLNDVFGEDLTDAKLLLWTCALSGDDESAELQYTVGNAIRLIDGRVDRKQITEPDIILVTKDSFIICEAKLGKTGICSHLWECSRGKDGVKSEGPELRYDSYFKNNDNPFRDGIVKEDKIYNDYAYQLFRMAFYSYHIAQKLNLKPKLVSLTNDLWWDLDRKKSPRPSQLWADFLPYLDGEKLPAKNIFWRDIELALARAKRPS